MHVRPADGAAGRGTRASSSDDCAHDARPAAAGSGRRGRGREEAHGVQDGGRARACQIGLSLRDGSGEGRFCGVELVC